MSSLAKCHLLSVGSAPRNNTMEWINDELLVYAGLSDICIARMINQADEKLVPEAVLSVLHKATFRSLRLVKRASQLNDEFEAVGTTSDGYLLVLKFRHRDDANIKWSYEIIFEEKIAVDKMVDAFVFRDSSELVICYSTFVRIEFYQLDSSHKIKSRHFMQMADNYFIMVNCLNVIPIVPNKFLCTFGLTNKKLGVYIWDATLTNEENSEFKPQLLDSREAVYNLDVRKDNKNLDDPFSFEVLAGTEERVQIWKLCKAKNTQISKTVMAFSLESQHHLHFENSISLVAYLDSNILITKVEHLSALRWDNQRSSFVVATRENSVKVYALENDSDKEGLWTFKREVCSFGEPAFELCGIFDPCFSPSSKWLLAHNTIGGFYLFKCDNEFNFTPTSVYIGGHGGKVRSLTWHEDGDILLTVGSDKSARYYMEYSTNNSQNGYWGQRSRPQVHGHEIRCIASLGSCGFVSGATEHMFRVFDNRIPCLSIEQAIERIQPLNLTPKQPSNTDNSTTTQNGLEINTNAPLNEELLQCGATVHEEKRKLYGHGNECYAVVTSPDYSLTFTAAKGSRPDESQLLVWRVEGWKLEQRLTDHTLTITAMSVSSDGRWLLTVSRDRSFAVYEILQNSQSEPLRLKVHQKQAHKRVIWDCAWIPNSSKFVTGSRDGVVGLFEVENNADQVKELQKWTVGECVSALSVGERLSDGQQIIVIATESGWLHIAPIENDLIKIDKSEKLSRTDGFSLSSLIYSIRYNSKRKMFAICSESGIVKSFSL